MNAHRAEGEGPCHVKIVKFVEIEIFHHGEEQPQERIGEGTKHEAEHEHLLASDSLGEGRSSVTKGLVQPRRFGEMLSHQIPHGGRGAGLLFGLKGGKGVNRQPARVIYDC